MIEVLSPRKLVTIRKPQRCNACYRKFDAGTKMHSQNCATDGHAYTWRMCETCRTLINEFHEMFYDDIERCYNEGCVTEGYHEKINTPELLLEYLRAELEKKPTHHDNQ